MERKRDHKITNIQRTQSEKESSNNSPLGDGGEKGFNMFYGADPIIFEKADELRSRMTAAEEIFWNYIKINKWHIKFRRQHPLSRFVADFYCHKIKLVIELDGGYHQDKEVKLYDQQRESEISQFGITVLRFKNEEIVNDIENVERKLDQTITNIMNAQSKAASSNNSPLGDGGKLFVIKIGGNVADDEQKLSSFLQKFASIDAKKILIHGGGKIATKIGESLGIKSNYINGRRITDAATIDLVTMVYGGLVNKQMVAQLQALHCNAIGLTGADANIMPAKKRPITKEGIDFGFVGDVDHAAFNIQNLRLLIDASLTPIIAPLTHDGDGQMLNTNADTVASSLAVALSNLYHVRLIYCFEKKGVLENVEDDNSVINLITKEKYRNLLQDKKLFDGILPKIDNAFDAINSGVKEVLIGDAEDLLQNLTDHTKGTLIK